MSKKWTIGVTGDQGFIGSKVRKALEDKGYKVLGFDKVMGDDLLEIEQVDRFVRSVDIVFHIAAQADLTQMTEDPDSGRLGVFANVEATHNVAYLCATYKKWLIYASTVCVYGNLPEEAHPAHEDKALPNPSELYACSKYAAEWIVRGYGLNYDMPWTIQRYATIYGPGMRKALGMYVFFDQAMHGDPITVHGDGHQDRTLTHVDDLVRGIIAPLDHPAEAQNQIFNLTTNEPISANRMAADITDLTKTTSHTLHVQQRNNQTIHEDFDNSKAKELLRWEPEISWEEGLKDTYEWMKSQVGK